MNEEITFGMGLDTTSFGRGIREVKNMAKEAKNSVKESFAELGRSLAAPFAGLATVEGFKKVLEFGESITRAAEEAGVSTAFIQTLGTAMRQSGSSAEIGQKGLEKLNAEIGKARASGDTKVFDEMGISLEDTNGIAKSSEQVFREVADRIHGAKDASDAARIAVAAFGEKIGNQLIPALREGSAGLDKFKDSMKLSDTDLAAIKQMNQDFSYGGEVVLVYTSKLVKFLGVVFQVMGAFAGGGRGGVKNWWNTLNIEDSPEETAKRAKKIADAAKAAAGGAENEAVKTLQEKLREQHEKAATEGTDKTERVIELNRQMADLFAKTGDNVKRNAEYYKNLIKLSQVAVELHKAEKDQSDEALENDKKRSAEAEKQRVLNEQIFHATQERDEAVSNLAEKKAGRSKYSIDELANSKFNFGGDLGDDQQKAKQIKELERQGQWNKDHGFKDDAAARFASADEIRNTLSKANVLEADRDPDKSLEKHVKDTTDALKKLTAQETVLRVNVERIKLEP